MTITGHRTSTHATGPGGIWQERAEGVAGRIESAAAAHDRDGSFVAGSFEILAAEGFVELLVPAELGGGGASHAEVAAVLRTLGRGCGSTAVTLSMHQHLVATQLWRYNRGQPAEGFLQKVATERPWLVSTGAADWVDSTGTARAVDGGFRISARKAPASGAPVGDLLVTSVAWPDAPDGPQVIHCAVPFAADGVTIEATWDAMGMRGTGSDTVVLDDVFVPDATVSLVRPAGAWHPVWNAVVGSALPLIMSAYVGVAEAAADLAVASARARNSAVVAPQVGTMLNQLTVGRDLVAAMVESSEDLRFAPTMEHTTATLSRKTMATEALLAAVRVALDICGGTGFQRSHGIERLYRDVHGALHHPLPFARQVAFTGRVALGLDPLES